MRIDLEKEQKPLSTNRLLELIDAIDQNEFHEMLKKVLTKHVNSLNSSYFYHFSLLIA